MTSSGAVLPSTAGEQWLIRKPAVESRVGLVACQHHVAADIGAAVLREGGNAVDAAVATGLAMGTVEPWMSGIGGGGYMTVYTAETDRVDVVEFGMRAPLRSVPNDYPIVSEVTTGPDTFNWPRIESDANIHGPKSIAVPGHIAGMALALETFGTYEWTDVIEPACQSAERGLPVDWYATHMITGSARGLAIYDETQKTYLPDGLPLAGGPEGRFQFHPIGNLGRTYRLLQKQGPSSFYEGEVGELIAHDLATAGSRIQADDLQQYSASIGEPLQHEHGDATVFVAGHLTAGPTLVRALTELERRLDSLPTRVLDEQAYFAFTDALLAGYEHRLEHLGEGSMPSSPSNTTHVCVADSDGNLVSLTQTIMSAFGSRIMLPGTGIVMNNGMMWFDPRPGGPNSVVGGRRPLCNMCPTVVRLKDSVFAAGACGGRKILASVFQLISFLADFGLSVDEAVHTPRIDVSGTDLVSIMSHMKPEFTQALQNRYATTRVIPNGVSPTLFGLPQLVLRRSDGLCSGGCFIPSPHAKVAAA